MDDGTIANYRRIQMIDLYIHMHQISFEDCGVLGGRTAFMAGTEIHNVGGKAPMDFIEDVLGILVKRSGNGQYIYPFSRIAVCFIDMDGNVSVAYTGDHDIENNTYSYIDNRGNTGKVFQYYDIGRILEQRNIQMYAIFQQQDDETYRVIGNKVHNERFFDSIFKDSKVRVQKSIDSFTSSFGGDLGRTNISGHYEISDGIRERRRMEIATDVPDNETCEDRSKICDYVYDVVRCLDVRGACKARVVEASVFHNYIRYDMGNGFYIEAFDNVDTDSREYWVGRAFTSRKVLLDCFAVDDPAGRDLIGPDWKVNIDKRFAEIMCRFLERDEYMFIDNDYDLEVLKLKRP